LNDTSCTSYNGTGDHIFEPLYKGHLSIMVIFAGSLEWPL